MSIDIVTAIRDEMKIGSGPLNDNQLKYMKRHITTILDRVKGLRGAKIE